MPSWGVSITGTCGFVFTAQSLLEPLTWTQRHWTPVPVSRRPQVTKVVGGGGSGPRLTPEEVRFLVLSLAHRASSSSSPSLCGHRLQSCVSAWLPIDMAYAGKDTLTFGPEQATHGALS